MQQFCRFILCQLTYLKSICQCLDLVTCHLNLYTPKLHFELQNPIYMTWGKAKSITHNRVRQTYFYMGRLNFIIEIQGEQWILQHGCAGLDSPGSLTQDKRFDIMLCGCPIVFGHNLSHWVTITAMKAESLDWNTSAKFTSLLILIHIKVPDCGHHKPSRSTTLCTIFKHCQRIHCHAQLANRGP